MDVAIRCIGMDPLQMVAGGRYELYSAYPIRVSAVPASVFRDAMRRFATSCIRVRQENRHTQVLPGRRQLSDGGTGGRASDADPAAARDTWEIRFLDGSYLMYILVSTCLAQEVTTHGKEGNPHGSTVGK